MQQVCREIESSKSTAFVSSKSLWFSDMARRCFRASISFLSNTTWPIGTVGIFFKCLIVWENCSISHQLPIITRKAGPLKNQKTIQNLTSIFNFLPGSIPPTSFLLGKPRLTLRSPLPSDSIGQTGFKCPFSGNAMTGTTEFNSSLKVTRGRFVFTLEGGSKSMTSKNVEWHKKKSVKVENDEIDMEIIPNQYRVCQRQVWRFSTTNHVDFLRKKWRNLKLLKPPLATHPSAGWRSRWIQGRTWGQPFGHHELPSVMCLGSKLRFRITNRNI